MTAPVTSPTTRAELTRLARIALTFEHADIEDDLAALSPLDGADLHTTFVELIEALQWQQRVRDGDVTVHEVEPELAHPGVLADRAQDRVEDALDTLLGGG